MLVSSPFEISFSTSVQCHACCSPRHCKLIMLAMLHGCYALGQSSCKLLNHIMGKILKKVPICSAEPQQGRRAHLDQFASIGGYLVFTAGWILGWGKDGQGNGRNFQSLFKLFLETQTWKRLTSVTLTIISLCHLDAQDLFYGYCNIGINVIAGLCKAQKLPNTYLSILNIYAIFLIVRMHHILPSTGGIFF